MKSILNKYKKIYFIGIGGSSMSGLAEFMLEEDIQVFGSDMQESSAVKKLITRGASIHIPHDADFLKSVMPDLVVYTVAISENNPEFLMAKELNIPMMVRAEFLGLIMKTHAIRIGVSGTHGKTTTTSMISSIIYQNNLDPSIHIGGVLPIINSNNHVGNGNIFITEACEYHRSFLNFYPNIAVILNIELDHVDYFKDLEDFKDAFRDYVKLIPENGHLIVNNDDSDAMDIAKCCNANIITFGLNDGADWIAKDISVTLDGITTYALYHNDVKVTDIVLNIAGTHNVYNSLAAIATCVVAGLEIDRCIKPLATFTGAGRRFDKVGEKNGFVIIDDYAHHPTEVKSTLYAARCMCPDKKVWCVFQPHTYTRTRELISDFKESFSDADYVLVTDIYAAREKDPGDINSQMLVDAINSFSGNARYFSSFEDAAAEIIKNASEGDLVFTMGAGTITKLGKIILDA